MDNGEVIQGLNEDWTLGGAKITEWMAGCMAFMVSQELIFQGPAPRYMPVLIAIGISVTFSMSALRRQYEDEERGLRNQVMVALGLPPPGLPTPASLQPYWSASPLKELKPTCELVQLGIDKVFEVQGQDNEDDTAPNFPFQRPIGMTANPDLSKPVTTSVEVATADEKAIEAA